MKKKKSLTGSFACKLIAYILLAVSVCVGLLALVGTVFLVEEDVYSYSQVGWLEDYFADRLHSDADYILEMLQNSEWEHMQDFCEHSNLDVVITREFEETAKTVWSDYMGGYDTPFAYSFVWEDPDADIGNHYTVKMYINPDFPETDDYSRLYSVANLLYTWRIAIPIVAGVCVFLALFCFIFLMCSAGHKNGMDGIVPSVLHPIPLDIVTILFAVVALFGVFVYIEG
ncbi:MAG: hypothetical protein IJ833_04055, partial [Lachnospiraceae bacterium]|nr:hypothetical protein [Lachnospiraceae bacterium]